MSSLKYTVLHECINRTATEQVVRFWIAVPCQATLSLTSRVHPNGGAHALEHRRVQNDAQELSRKCVC